MVHAQSIIYVKINAKGANDGTSWNNAYTNLQDGINKASQVGAMVWVASGTYTPNRDSLNVIPSNKRNACFLLKSEVKVYGGFNGTEIKMILRDPLKYQTILSGEIGDTTTSTDNSYHVVYASLNTLKTAVLDGFMILNGSGSSSNGGGAYLLGGTITNCTFINNSATNGGAIYARNAYIKSCVYSFNTATANGGALYAVSSNIDSCTFRNNTAVNGGALYVTQGNETNCTIYSNKASNQGGGIYSNGSGIQAVRILNNSANQGGGLYNTNNSLVVNTLVTNNYALTDGGGIYSSNGGMFTNVTIARNKSENKSGGMYSTGSNTVRNTVIWNNVPSNIINSSSSASFSNVALSDSSKITGSNLIVLDSTAGVFVNPADSIGNIITGNGINYLLKANWQPCLYSALIDKGDNSFISLTTDLNGKIRVINSKQSPYDNDTFAQVDIGACEAVGNTVINGKHIIYIKQDWNGIGDGSSWDNATSNLDALFTFLNASNSLPTDLQVWVQQGTYYPTNIKLGFHLTANASIYGGFYGDETVLEQRDWINNPTTLSGDIGVKLDVNDNIETVISIISSSLIDGFVIYNGKYRGISIVNNSTIRNCEIMYCGTAKKLSTDPYIYGAGLYGDNCIIDNCKIHNNKTKYGCGGGIYLQTGTISNCTIYNNEANANDGGGVMMFNARMIQTLVHDNAILATINPYVTSGGVFCYNSTIDNSEIYKNNSQNSAGGVNLIGNSIIRNSKIWGNIATSNGGGLYCDHSTFVFNSLIENNKSYSYGGGSYNGQFINSIIANNEASVAGGVCEPNLLEYSTVVNNAVTNDYSGITLTTGKIRYCVIWGNKGGTAQFIQINGSGSFDYSAIEGGFSGNSTLALFAANDDIYGPNFLAPSPVAGNTTTSGDWHLLSTSPLIDRSLIDKETPSKDYYNNCRVIGLAPDLGAAEFGTSEYDSIKTKRIYVKQGATGNGTSWDNAIGDLNKALFIAGYKNIHEVWVVAGSYYPSTTRERWISFNLRDSVYLYGGFAGTELFLEERNIAANETILSGDIGRRMRNYDNSFNIAYFNPLTASDTTSIDGFTIANGYYEGETDGFPHALYIRHASISNCTFVSNYTNALDAENCTIKNCSFIANNSDTVVNSAVTVNHCIVDNCTFNANIGRNGGAMNANNSQITHCSASGNYASLNGGAFYLNNSSLESCSIFNNSSKQFGGGIYAQGKAVTIFNSLIYNNASDSLGAGLYLDSIGSIYASTITRNLSKASAGGVYMRNAQVSAFYNNILWRNDSRPTKCSFVLENAILPNIHNCGIDDTLFTANFTAKLAIDTANYGKDSITFSPKFVYPTFFSGTALTDTQKSMIRYVNWSLNAYSGAIDKGAALPLVKLDYAGNLRTIDGDKDNIALPDLGAYESKSNKIIPSQNKIVYISPQWKGNGDGSSWQNARDNIQEVIDTLSLHKGGTMWISKGTYTPVIDYREFNDSTDVRTKSFILKRKVSIYGGFDETDSLMSQRDISGNKTILSGVPPLSQNRGNLYHVVYSGAENDTAEINGFYITGGVADHFSIDQYKDGGGAYMLNGDIVKCYLIGNTAFQYGGAAALRNKSRMINCVVANNYSYRRAGGVYGTDSSTVSLTTIVNNGTGLINGGAEITGASTVVNSILWNNFAKKDPQINTGATFAYSAVQSPLALTQPHSILLASKNSNSKPDSLYPYFVAPSTILGQPSADQINQAFAADWSVTRQSSCINKGQLPNAIVASKDNTDLFENPRVYADTVDIGAYEYGSFPIITHDIADIKLCESKSASLSILATGKNLKYQWQYFGVNKWINIPENEYFNGIQSSSLIIDNATTDMTDMNIRCMIWNSTGTVYSKEIVCTVFELPVVFDQSTIKLCGKQKLMAIDSTSYTYLWNTNSTTSSIIPTTTDWYKLSVTNSYGCQNIDSIWVTLYKQPVEPFKDSLIQTCAGKPVILQPPVYQRYVWQDGSDGDTYIAYNTGTYTLKATDENGCTITDSVTVRVVSHPIEELNIVTYNKQGTTILVDWTTKDANAIIGHELYRKSDNSGNYVQIGTIDKGSPDEFIDTSAHSAKQYSYAITFRDTCGVESAFSLPHTPIVVNANYRVSNRTIVDLNWTPYKGLTYNSYILQRGKTTDNLTTFATIPSTELYYTLAIDGYNYYRIAIPILNPFTIDDTVYEYAYSNISEISDLVLENINSLSDRSMQVFPNPSKGIVTVETEFASMPDFITLQISNTLGQIMSIEKLHPATNIFHTFSISDVSPGIYFLTVTTNNEILSKLLIVE